MKKSIGLFTAVIGATFFCVAVWAAEPKQKPEAPILPASAYRTSLEEIIVEGKLRPYWQSATPPRWDKPKVEAPVPGEAAPSRLQLAPRYTRDEREDYNGVRDQLANPPPRTKIFEIHF